MSSDTNREALAAKFERHADEEGKILTEYRAFAEKLGNSSAGNLVSHILTEEELHHLLLRTLASWLREHPTERERAVPPDANRDELLRLTHTLQRHERETIHACRALELELAGQAEEILATLLSVMILDSEKHHRLLGAVEKLLQS